MSNRNKLLITFEELRENSRISGNVEPSTLRPIVLLAQETDLQPLIGESLFEYFLDKRTNQGTYSGLSATFTVFVDDYLKPFMYNACVYEFVCSNSVSLDEIGVTVTTGPNSTEATDKELQAQRDKTQSTMNFYANRLRTFICDDRYWSEFSTYYGADKQNIYPTQRINKGGVYFPKSNERWTNWSNYQIP